MKQSRTAVVRELVLANPTMLAREIAKKAKVDISTVYGVRHEFKKKGILGKSTLPEVATTKTPIEQLRDEVKTKADLEVAHEYDATVNFIAKIGLNFNLGSAVAYTVRAAQVAESDAEKIDDLKSAVWHINKEIKRLSA